MQNDLKNLVTSRDSSLRGLGEIQKIVMFDYASV